jgi:hypothetical protein
MSASLIGRLGSSAFRLFTAAVSVEKTERATVRGFHLVSCSLLPTAKSLHIGKSWFHLFIAMGGQADIRQVVHFGRGVPVAPLPQTSISS